MSHPPFDIELQAALAEIAALMPPTLTPDLIPEMRKRNTDFGPTDEDLRRGGAIEITWRTIPGGDGGPDLRVLICRPAGLSMPAPGIVNIHGGGMVMGDATTGIDVALDWVEEFQSVVVSIEYRLAPEFPDPLPVVDCFAGLKWAASHAAELGIDPRRLVLAGGSAGGGLAAGVALMARDQGGPDLTGLILMCPMLDDRNITGSSRELVGEGIWDRPSNLVGWDALLGSRRGTEDVSPYAAPARAVDLSGLPPVLIDVGSVETFRDEAVDFASRIWAAAGSAELHVWPGGFHGFDVLVPQSALAQAARQARKSWLHRLFNTVPNAVWG